MTQSAARQPIPVGKYFLDRNMISQHQLELALQHRAEFGLKLGQSLVELGFVTESDMVEALRHQARFPCIHLTSGIVEARVAAKVGELVSRRLRALALNQVAGHTTVALEDPTDPQALEELSHLLATRIFPVYAEPSVIQALQDQIFGKGRVASQAAAPNAAPAAAPAPAAATATAQARAPRPTQFVPRETPAPEPAPASTSAPDDRAVVESVRGFLMQAFERGASDIHLEARREELAVRFRIDGALHGHSRLPGSWARPVVACLKALAHIDAEESGEHEPPPSPGAREGSIPFVFKKQNYEVRISTLPGAHGESAVLHVHGGKRGRDLERLGLQPGHLARLQPILAAREGLVFVAGPAGSGRTTTLEAMLARLAAPQRKVVALVERVEHELDGVLYVRASDQHGSDHAARVHALIGQDPDVLAVPELDGRVMARSLLDAALAGRKILTSLRARSALDTLTRLVQFGLEPYLLADALCGVVAQRLVRRICPGCKTPIVPDEALCAHLGLPRDDATYFEGAGCEACHGTGFGERIALFEVLNVTPGLRRELEKGSNLEALRQAARAEGFTSLREHGLQQARAGSTTLHEVLVATAEG